MRGGIQKQILCMLIRDKFFVGNYIYIIVANKKTLRAHRDKTCICLYRDKIFVGNYIYIIVANKKICICLYRSKFLLATIYIL